MIRLSGASLQACAASIIVLACIRRRQRFGLELWIVACGRDLGGALTKGIAGNTDGGAVQEAEADATRWLPSRAVRTNRSCGRRLMLGVQLD